MLSLKVVLTILATFGALQLLILMQYSVSNVRQDIPRCDCSCARQVHIETKDNFPIGGEIKIKPPSKDLSEKDGDHQNSDEESEREAILEAEDKEYDKKLGANKTIVEEDPEERSPYQQDNLDGKDTETAFNTMIPRPLDVNPLINASGFNCSKPTENILLIYVYTAPQNFDKRLRIRKLYGSVKEFSGIRLQYLFFIGALSADKPQFMYKKLLDESQKYGDIIQDRSYIDAYRNLTLKGISAITWISRYCPETYRVMKIDDDTLVNPYNLVIFMKGQSEITMSEVICKVTQGVGPIRNPKSKYYVSEAEYKDKFYPTYCQGFAYIFPPSALSDIANYYDPGKVIVMEDVYLTGITAQNLGLRLHSLTAMFSTTFSKFDLFLERITTRQELFLIGHVQYQKDAELFWSLVQQRISSKFEELKVEPKNITVPRENR